MVILVGPSVGCTDSSLRLPFPYGGPGRAAATSPSYIVTIGWLLGLESLKGPNEASLRQRHGTSQPMVANPMGSERRAFDLVLVTQRDDSN